MTKFSRVLNELLMEHGYSQTDLANLSGVEQVKISRLVNSQARPNHADLIGLFGSFNEPQDKYRIARAHIADELPESALRLLEVELASRAIRERSVNHAVLPVRVQKAWEFLVREFTDNPAIGDVIADLATALGWEGYPSPGSKKDTARKIVDTLKPKKLVRYPPPSE